MVVSISFSPYIYSCNLSFYVTLNPRTLNPNSYGRTRPKAGARAALLSKATRAGKPAEESSAYSSLRVLLHGFRVYGLGLGLLSVI